ncbi:MAG: YitT family protein [Pseudomonadota bacterium]
MNKKEIIRDYIFITLGCLLIALSVIWFLDPYKIVPGGLTGLGIILYESFKIPLGTTILIFNIPLLIIGVIFLGKSFGIKSVYGIIASTMLIDLLKSVIYPYLLPNIPIYLLQNPATIDYTSSVVPFLAAIFGGILLGVGVGIVFTRRGSTGGSDVIAQIAVNYHLMKAGQMFLIIDSTIILSAGIVFGVQHHSLAYGVTAILLGLSSVIASVLVIDFIMDGGRHVKGVTIISDKSDELKGVILNKLEKGATIYYGEGAYTGEAKRVIFSVVSNRQIYSIKQAVKEIDPNAFIIVNNVAQVYGEGFERIKTP